MSETMSGRMHPAVKLAFWVTSAGLLAWAAFAAGEVSATLPLLTLVAFSATALFGLGELTIRAAGLPSGAFGAVLGRVAVGWVVASIVVLAKTYLGFGQFAMWGVVVLGAAGWLWTAVASGRQVLGRGWRWLSSDLLAAEAVAGAAVMRVVVAGSRYFERADDTGTALSQYFDLTYHLAFVKSGLVRGIPVQEYPLMFGLPKRAYHAAYDLLLTVLLKGLHLPADRTYFGALLPLTFAMLLFGMYAAAFAWQGRARAGMLAIAIPSLTLLGTFVPLYIAEKVGEFGVRPLKWLLYNPPGALAATAVLVVIALISAKGTPGWRAAAIAGVVSGAIIAMKAQSALAAGPALVIALGVALVRKEIKWPTALVGTLAAAVSAGLAYLTTRGAGGMPVIEFGAVARAIQTSEAMEASGALWHSLAASASEPFGDTLFLLTYVLIGITGWRLLAALVAVPWAFRSPRDGFRRSGIVWYYLAGLVVAVIAVAATLVQRDEFAFMPLNIAWHTIQLVWPLSALVAAVLLDAALPSPLAPRVPEPLRWLAVLALVVPLALVGSVGMQRARHFVTGRVSDSVMRVLAAVPRLTPPDAVIVQRFDTRSIGWVSGFAGRRVYLERSKSSELTRGLDQHRARVIEQLYAAQRPAAARTIA
ncbi:MAG: hypothetical protein HY876_04885, partial [Coriobacteriales bacterium]|nr:hypothetical protein [Coriobacteriales bacterium]